MHAYSMKDCARERYILALTILAIGFVAIAKQAAGMIGVTVSVGIISAFGAAYYVFDRWAWRWPLLSRIVAIPDLAGIWAISGRTNGADGQPREWSAEARIEQSWSRIAISIETTTSRSRSGMAAVERDPGHGFRLVYGYINEPKTTDGELRSHRGTCEVVFAPDLLTGQGLYFNDHQRRTVGEMQWKRTSNNGVQK
ncbi:MAG: hypothetical protein WD069_21620 [Planctomycetales bacterium]